MTENPDPRDTAGASVVGRRTIVAGAAWTIPVVAATVATPAFAASPCPPTAHNELLVGNGQGPVSIQELSFSYDTTLTYEVVGGTGGGELPGDHENGGWGARLTGSYVVTAGTVLTLVAGGTGAPLGLDPAPGGLGGTGYGNGGAGGLASSGGTNYAGAGGGGGSALLLGTLALTPVPLVVAGGGGGFATARGLNIGGEWATTLAQIWTGGDGGTLDAANGGAGSWTMTRLDGTQEFSMSAGGGQGAVGDVGGTTAIGGYAQTNGVPGTNIDVVTVAGPAGDHGSGANGGGNGSDGATNSSAFEWFGGGGGGGGWAGGSGGPGRFSGYDMSNYVTAGGPGGGGSSYLSPLAANSSVSTTNGMSGNGFIRLSWEEPCPVTP